jgi:tetraacyldisaccharide 4'-kinase
MTGDGQAPFFSLATALFAASVIYGFGHRLRSFAYELGLLRSRRLPCRVICVGNITVGGTGKTPMTMHVAQGLQQSGFRAAVVSRGYRGGAESHGGIVSDGQTIKMQPEQSGDEPYLMARGLREIPVIVGKNRYEAGLLAVHHFQPDVIVLDDGFQHFGLKRDVDLVLLDHANPFGNSHLIPRGILREPVSALARSTACVLTRYRSGLNGESRNTLDRVRRHMPQGPVFTASHVPYCYAVKSREQISDNGIISLHAAQDVGRLVNEPVFGFSGIARNTEFQHTVKALGFNATGFVAFSDHHRYVSREINEIQSKAETTGARRLITTEKDLVRLLPQNPFGLDLIVAGVKVSLGDAQQEFMSFLKNRLSL